VSITAEKKQHTLKNTVMALPDKFIIFLGRTFSGHNHDYLMLKQELPPELDWFADINVRVDLGYLGIKSDYRGEQIDIPTRKPRKSQKHPNPQLSEEQKAANTALSRVRIFIEHAIGGMKRYNILVQGVDRLLIDATERAYHRLQDETKQREHYSGKKTRIAN